MSSRKKCQHGYDQYTCKECKLLGIGGKGLCEHNRQPYSCKQCHGAGICEHDRFRSTCKDCGAVHNNCPHGKSSRSRCKQCGGSEICEHDRMRYGCKQCKGGGVCVHDRDKSKCSRCCPQGAYKKCKRGAVRGMGKRVGTRVIPFELTLEEFKWIVNSSCVSCGESIKPMTCDRVDSSKGYSFDNCQPLCDPCNSMKLDWLEQEFENHIIKIIQHRPELAERAGFQLPIRQLQGLS